MSAKEPGTKKEKNDYLKKKLFWKEKNKTIIFREKERTWY